MYSWKTTKCSTLLSKDPGIPLHILFCIVATVFMLLMFTCWTNIPLNLLGELDRSTNKLLPSTNISITVPQPLTAGTTTLLFLVNLLEPLLIRIIVCIGPELSLFSCPNIPISNSPSPLMSITSVPYAPLRANCDTWKFLQSCHCHH